MGRAPRRRRRCATTGRRTRRSRVRHGRGDAVAALAALGRGGESVELTAPSSPGTYYYGACVAAVTDESDTTNNCSASVPVTVSAGGEPATEVHLFTPVTVEEGGDTFLVVAAWTSGDRPPSVSIPVRVWLVEGTAKEGVDFPPALPIGRRSNRRISHSKEHGTKRVK